MSPFALAPAFDAVSTAIGDLQLCHVRLMQDHRFAWLTLVPRVADVREMEDLSPADRAVLMEEIIAAGGAVRAIGQALGRPVEKLNVGQMGNTTPQLHIHVTGRRSDDVAWPLAPWGSGAPQRYGADEQALALAAARQALGI